jgi:hypothetical protein
VLKKDIPEGTIGCVVPLHQKLFVGTLRGILRQTQVDSTDIRYCYEPPFIPFCLSPIKTPVLFSLVTQSPFDASPKFRHTGFSDSRLNVNYGVTFRPF